MNQHYVPRTYLKNFAFQNKINVYDKQNRRYYSPNIVNIAAEKDMYRINNSSDIQLVSDENVWERYYSEKIEPELSRLLKLLINKCDNNLINDRSVVFDNDLRKRLSLQLIYQIYRGKSAFIEVDNKRDKLYEDIKKEAEDLAIELYGENHNIDIDRYINNEDLLKLSFAETSINGEAHETLFNGLMNRSWILYKTVGEDFFITSDNPVLLHETTTDKVGLFNAGLGYDTTVLYYPISPRLMLAIYSNSFLLGKFSEMNNQICIIKDRKFVDQINKLQVRQCIRQVYSKHTIPKYLCDIS